jgi:AcrR family transcriptional regulator
MTSVKPRRSYRSPVREQSAQRSRDAVIAAAHTVFVEQGYASATIEQIARRAGVSRPTVFGVGTKAKLLALARLKAIAGEHLVGNDQRFQELLGISDPSELIATFARFTADIARRLGPLAAVLEQAAPTDPELGELLRRSQHELLDCARTVITAVHATGAIHPGHSPSRAADVLWLLIQPSQYQRLVAERGWSHRTYEHWQALTMVSVIIGTTADSRQ